MSQSNALPFLNLSLKLRVALFEFVNMIELPLPRFTSGKRIASSLQGYSVVRVNSDARERTLATTRLANAVGGG